MKYYVRVYQKTNTGLATLSEQELSLFPNPVVDIAHIKSSQKIERIAIYNVLGKKVKEFSFVENQINLNELSAGYYVAKIKFRNGFVGQKCFIKK